MACGARDVGVFGVAIMAIEVDYFAWEKWQQTEHDFDDYSRKWWHKLPYFFVDKGTQWRVKTGVLIASMFYIRGDMPIAAVFEFFAENEAAPISKILRTAVTIRERNRVHIGSDVYYDELALDKETAVRLHKRFASLPEPGRGGMDITSSRRRLDSYKVHLASRYGVKAFDWSDGHENFSLPDDSYTRFFSTIDQILTICENLMPHRYPNAETIRQALETYEKAFQLKAKYMKHRGRWPHPKSSRYHRYDMEELESFKTKDMQESGNHIDFKYYLPRFLKFMAFDRPYIQEFTSEHETILFSKLLEAELHTWDEDEKKTLTDYFLALFKYNLSYYPSITLAASRLLLWLIKLELDLVPFLIHWEDTFEHVDSLRHLGAFLERLIDENMVDSLPNALADWLGQATLEKALSDAVNSYQAKRPYAPEFLKALENLQLIRA
jgi:hypothetical protein